MLRHAVDVPKGVNLVHVTLVYLLLKIVSVGSELVIDGNFLAALYSSQQGLFRILRKAIEPCSLVVHNDARTMSSRIDVSPGFVVIGFPVTVSHVGSSMLFFESLIKMSMAILLLVF